MVQTISSITKHIHFYCSLIQSLFILYSFIYLSFWLFFFLFSGELKKGKDLPANFSTCPKVPHKYYLLIKFYNRRFVSCYTCNKLKLTFKQLLIWIYRQKLCVNCLSQFFLSSKMFTFIVAKHSLLDLFDFFQSLFLYLSVHLSVCQSFLFS